MHQKSSQLKFQAYCRCSCFLHHPYIPRSLHYTHVHHADEYTQQQTYRAYRSIITPSWCSVSQLVGKSLAVLLCLLSELVSKAKLWPVHWTEHSKRTIMPGIKQFYYYYTVLIVLWRVLVTIWCASSNISCLKGCGTSTNGLLFCLLNSCSLELCVEQCQLPHCIMLNYTYTYLVWILWFVPWSHLPFFGHHSNLGNYTHEYIHTIMKRVEGCSREVRVWHTFKHGWKMLLVLGFLKDRRDVCYLFKIARALVDSH